MWPCAVVYDIEGHRACMIDRLNAGHDPLRGMYNVGERCTISGSYKRKIGFGTFLMKVWDAQAPEASPLREEVPTGR
jgi:hypothetical protein